MAELSAHCTMAIMDPRSLEVFYRAVGAGWIGIGLIAPVAIARELAAVARMAQAVASDKL